MMEYSLKATERRGCGSCLRWFMFVANVFLLLAGSAVAAVFLYLQITQVDFVTDALGTPLVLIADSVVIGAGCLLIVAAFIGLLSACTRHTGFIATTMMLLAYEINNASTRWGDFSDYQSKLVVAEFQTNHPRKDTKSRLGVAHQNFIMLIPIFLALLAGIVCAFVFKTWLTDPVRLEMRKLIQEVYGVNLDQSYNRRVTQSINKSQTQWKCCAVDDQSWYLYQDSLWYRDQPGTPGSSTNPKPYVPKSCCVLDGNGEISAGDLLRCQTTSNGPPARRAGDQYAGEVNTALRYRGCYEAAKDSMINDQFSWFLIMVCLCGAVAFLVLIGITVSISFFVSRKRDATRFRSADDSAEKMQLTRRF